MATRNDIIERALDLIGVKASEEGAEPTDVSTAANALNSMIKTWSTSHPHLWNRNSATLFLQPTQIKYILPTTDRATEDFTQTTLSAGVIATDTTIPLTATTGLLVGDNIGIKLDSGSLHWSTIASLSPTVINDAMPSAAASGNVVYYYTTDLVKPLRVPDARRQQGQVPNAQEIEMIPLGRIDYLNLPNKNTSGTPVQFYYDPKITTGEIFIWPAPTTTDTFINFTYYKPLVGFADAADTGDFPEEWQETLEYNLAVRLAPGYGVTAPREVTEIAGILYNNLLNWDQGDASVFSQYGRGRGQ